ncbi:thiamine phosphate synthase [Candidatus Pelagibacter sp.]|nr:thiamine phosphate synthase [Candidatus Pelagibacter sp.]
MFRKYYFISKLETNIIDKLDNRTIVIYRNYYQQVPSKDEILNIKKYCKKKKIKFFIANNIKLAIKLGLDGAYIPSFNKSTRHLAFSFNKKFSIIGSAHNIKEIRIKELQNVERVFISSLFKKNKNYLGINKFKLISNYTKKKVVVLGGISKKNISKLRLVNISEFAGISYFE